MASPVNASRARRRWLRWCRYQSKTKSVCNRKSSGYSHVGLVMAYSDATMAGRRAGRAYPRGARAVYYPDWVTY